MPAGFGPRFAAEAAFLLLLALFAGLADLRPLLIVAVVAAGWVLVSLLEVAFWQAEQREPRAVYARPAAASAGDPPLEDDPETADDVLAEPDEEPGYPLRAEAGRAPSEEEEAYTTILRDEAEVARAERGD